MRPSEHSTGPTERLSGGMGHPDALLERAPQHPAADPQTTPGYIEHLNVTVGSVGALNNVKGMLAGPARCCRFIGAYVL